MKKTLMLLLLFFLPLASAIDAGDVFQFSNHYGQYKEDLLVIEAFLTGDGCFYNYDGGSTYTNTNCHTNDLGVAIKISPDLNEITANYETDGYVILSSLRTTNCLTNDFSSSCVYPYNYYVWVADDDIFNLNEIMRFSSVEFVKADDYLYLIWAGNYPYSTLSLYDNIVFSDEIEDIYDLSNLEAVRYGFTSGSFGSKVCSANVITCLNNKAYCFANTDDVFLNSQSCDSKPTSRDDFTNYDRLFYSTNINYWSYPFYIRSIIVTTTTNDGSVYHNGLVNPTGSYDAPNHRHTYLSGEIDVLADSFFPSETPFRDYPTAFDSIMGVPLDTNKYDVSDISSVVVDIDFYMSDNYRHKSPLDQTAHFNDLFSVGDASDFSKDNTGVRYSITLTNIVSQELGGNETNDIYHDLNATINTGTTELNDGDINYNDFSSGFDSNEFEDEIEGLTRIAKTYYVLDQEKSFFSNMYGVALMLFGVFLMVYTLLASLLFLGIMGVLFFGLWSSMIKAIDEIFKHW